MNVVARLSILVVLFFGKIEAHRHHPHGGPPTSAPTAIHGAKVWCCASHFDCGQDDCAFFNGFQCPHGMGPCEETYEEDEGIDYMALQAHFRSGATRQEINWTAASLIVGALSSALLY